jgi:uncharacterized PurR-regulated membrane protein YhhQ (DUF165 family)
MSTLHEDRWLLPRHQAEYPSWRLVAEETLHGRREATFLVLAAVFLLTTTLLIVLGTSRVLDPSPVLAEALPDIELPIAMRIPFGVLPFAPGGLALVLICELYGRRRAGALVGIGLLESIALAGVMRLADRVDGSDAAFGPALAFATCYLVSYFIYLSLFGALRRRMAGRHFWLRLLVLSVAAQLVGWMAFGFAMYAYATRVGLPVQTDVAVIRSLVTGSALYTLAGVVLLTLPIELVARGLRLFLRVARYDTDDDDYRDGPGAQPTDLTHRRLPAAEIIDGDDVAMAPPARRRVARVSVQPYSSAEMRFFREGDQLAESGSES